ncbi:hypothetical protein [Ruegeria profundi]|uniref:hypothetical protein n=1 Tax=Ruegeria profundi TaxID=1685378 RepID=UPI001CD72D11|nr:hypothetical protein [Ruegeria profundi]MCA0930670.1 hypothetical protein [Ruegeria profundi]
MSGIFLMPLGLPWVRWFDGVADSLKPWLTVLAPVLNIAILTLLCRYFGGDEARKTKP